MIKLVLAGILLVLSPLVQAGLVFDESEKVVEIFHSQDFEANLTKAEEGDVRAQYLVGAAYLYGLEEQEVEVDHEKGLYWLKEAANQGAAEAYDELAIAYREGLGVEKDARKFEEYLAEAGERGMRAAKLELLDLYEDGDPELGIEPDEVKYLYWLEKTAEDGVLISMRNMAHTYRQGLGVEVDLEKAFEEWPAIGRSAAPGRTTGARRFRSRTPPGTPADRCRPASLPPPRRQSPGGGRG